MIQSAVILAAGRGNRLLEHGDDYPKAMIPLRPGLTIIQNQIRSLTACGITKVTVVTGYKAELLAEHVGKEVSTINNPDFATTNSLFSLMCASDVLRRGALILNSDVLCHDWLMRRLIEHVSPNAILVDFERALDDEGMKVQHAGGVVTRIAKTLVVEPGIGENVGIIKLGATDAPLFIEQAQALLREGGKMAWAPAVIDRLVGRVEFHAIPVNGVPWTEIDFPEDLRHAREVIFPLCMECDGSMPSPVKV